MDVASWAIFYHFRAPTDIAQETPRNRCKLQRHFLEDGWPEAAEACGRVWGIYAGSLTVINKSPFSYPQAHLGVNTGHCKRQFGGISRPMSHLNEKQRFPGRVMGLAASFQTSVLSPQTRGAVDSVAEPCINVVRGDL